MIVLVVLNSESLINNVKLAVWPDSVSLPTVRYNLPRAAAAAGPTVGSIFCHHQRIVSLFSGRYWAKSSETIMRVNRFAIELENNARLCRASRFANSIQHTDSTLCCDGAQPIIKWGTRKTRKREREKAARVKTEPVFAK